MMFISFKVYLPQRPMLSLTGRFGYVAILPKLSRLELTAGVEVEVTETCASVVEDTNPEVTSTKLIFEMQNNRLMIYLMHSLPCK